MHTTSHHLACLPDGRIMVNLGCGTRMHWGWNNVDLSYLGRLRRHMNFARRLYRLGILSEDRWHRLQQVDPDIILQDLRRGIPFPDNSVDVVYHSNFLEHIGRDAAPRFLRECWRVLKPGGVIRVVVPDLEQIAHSYLDALSALDAKEQGAEQAYQRALGEMFEQMVREEGTGTRLQRPVVRVIERLVRGDARKSGELHLWMYDRHSLSCLLLQAGFRDITLQHASSSRVSGWKEFALDDDSSEGIDSPHSLYLEALKQTIGNPMRDVTSAERAQP